MYDITKTEVSLDDFIKTFVPNLPACLEIADVLKRMDPGAWMNFSSPPAASPGSENAIFQKLTPLFDEMVRAAMMVPRSWETGLKQQWSLITEPTITPKTTERPTTIKPDAVFHRKGGSKSNSYSYYDIAFTAEFKKHSGPTNYLDALKHIMAVDARCRFTFGITIENTAMGLWYTNRSMLVGSKPLNIIEDRDSLLQVLLSFAFASDVEMGWDATVELLEGGSYRINVGDTEYDTLSVLQDAGTDILLSRGARIFKVKKAGNTDDKIYVLKDLWLENGRKPEHQIYEDILRDIGHQYSEGDAHTVKKHFLTPVESVFVKVNNVEDNTETIMMQSHTLISSEVVRMPIIIPSHSPASNSKTYLSPSDMEVDTDRDIIRTVREPEKTCYRRHYRIVFKEFAEPIYEVTTMRDVFTVLVDLIKVFRLIHGSGWVHRDVSVGNLYLFDGHGLLGDLEYAKRTDDNTQHDVRMGTIAFMPAEVMSLEYHFRPIKAPSMINYKAATEDEELPFRYNAIHDIESLWWVGVWMMFFNKPKHYEEPTKNSRKRQIEASEIFHGTVENGALHWKARLLYVKDPETFRAFAKRWFSEEFTAAIMAFDVVRDNITVLYRGIEESFPDGLSKLSATADQRNTREAFPGGPTSDIHEPIQNAFLAAKAQYDDANIELVSLKKDPNRSKMGKRRLGSSGEQRGDAGTAEEVGEGKGKRTRRPRGG